MPHGSCASALGGLFFTQHFWQIIVQGALLVCSAFFSSAETAFFNLSRSQLYRMRQGRGPSRLAASLMNSPQRLLNTLLLANMVVTTAYASISAIEVLDLERSGLPAWAAAAVSVVLLVLLILLGEVTPKMLALTLGERLAIAAAGPLAVIQRMLRPLLRLFHVLIIAPVLRLAAPARPPSGDITPRELVSLLDLSAKRGILDHDASTLLQEILALTDLRVRDIMVPRVDMVAFDVDGSPRDLMELFRRTRLRRIPVFEKDIDHVVGLVRARQLFLGPQTPLRQQFVKAPFVPLLANLERVLLQFRVTRTQTAIVVDEYGGTAGMVSLEDVLEEIVGDIPGEHEAAGGQAVQPIGPNEYLLDANLAIHEWAEAFKLKLPSRRISTIGGFVISLLGHIPRVGEQARFRNMTFTVELMRGRRIGKLRLYLKGGQTP